MEKCFVQVGMIPDEKGEWAEYNSAMTTGTLEFEPSGSIPAALLKNNEDKWLKNVINENVVDNYVLAEDDVASESSLHEKEDDGPDDLL